MKKICLYVIGYDGDCDYVERFLDSFKDSFDCFYALNTAKGEEWINTARKWCQKNSKLFRSKAFTDWQNTWDVPLHYGKARQMAKDSAEEEFSDATHFFWADLDDKLRAGSAQAIREAANQNHKAFSFIYNIENSEPFPRERMTVRGVGKWVWAIHEILKIDTPIHVCENVIFDHAKDRTKLEKKNHDKHIELLNSQLLNVPNYYLYKGKEYYNSGRFEESIEPYKAGIYLTECKFEKYNAQIRLAKIYNQKGERKQTNDILFEAIRGFPQRREAYYYLAHNSVSDLNFDDALAYIRAGNSLPRPAGFSFDWRIYEIDCYVLHWRILSKLMLYKEAWNIVQAVFPLAKWEDQHIREMNIIRALAEETDETKAGK